MNLNNREFAKDYLNESKLRLETAELAMNKKAYAFCVRQSQEVVELSLKAALRMIGIDFPKWHDVSPVLINEQEKFPDFFQEGILELKDISIALAKKRELSMYGDEISARSPSKVFSNKDAEVALRDAKFCYQRVEELFEKLQDVNNNEDIE